MTKVFGLAEVEVDVEGRKIRGASEKGRKVEKCCRFVTDLYRGLKTGDERAKSHSRIWIVGRLFIVRPLSCALLWWPAPVCTRVVAKRYETMRNFVAAWSGSH